MIITGEIKEVKSTSYTIGEKVINQKIILVEYNFYRFVTTICFTASETFQIPEDMQQLFNFEFDIKTKYVNEKLFTDFILTDISLASQIGESNFLIVVKTNFSKQNIEILKTEEIKGRLKHTVALSPKNAESKIIYAYYWDDNSYLKDVNDIDLLQLSCKSLPYKDRWINNVEIWRTVENDNFLGSII